MAIVLTTALRNTRIEQVRDAMEGGALVFTDGGAEVATLNIASDLSSVSAASGAITLNSSHISDDTSATGGTIDGAKVVDSLAASLITGITVGTSGTDIVFTSLAVSAGVTVSIGSNNLVITDGNAA